MFTLWRKNHFFEKARIFAYKRSYNTKPLYVSHVRQLNADSRYSRFCVHFPPMCVNSLPYINSVCIQFEIKPISNKLLLMRNRKRTNRHTKKSQVITLSWDVVGVNYLKKVKCQTKVFDNKG